MDAASATLAPVSELIAQYKSEQQAARTVGTGSEEVSKEMFLQLLVAQIRNQNPLSPADGLEFVSQLAEFSTLEQLIAIREGVDSLGEIAGAQFSEDASGGTAPVDGGNLDT